MASKKQTPAPKAKTKSAPVVVTPVRNTTLPPRKTATPVVAEPKKIAPTFDQISSRAYFIWQSSGGSQDDNWFRAERELRGV
jgi:hypothetical protein